ncbi:hypothetical protein ZWY2020_039666 [Hordeum vulgare]|nr:hypothetical protein ZWY2020_039666 [Hordeum vulgare]
MAGRKRRSGGRAVREGEEGARFFADDRSHYDLFGKRRPGDEEFRKAWQENVDEEDCLWTASEDEDEEKEDDTKWRGNEESEEASQGKWKPY